MKTDSTELFLVTQVFPGEVFKWILYENRHTATKAERPVFVHGFVAV